jgi:carbonic anhydrase
MSARPPLPVPLSPYPAAPLPSLSAIAAAAALVAGLHGQAVAETPATRVSVAAASPAATAPAPAVTSPAAPNAAAPAPADPLTDLRQRLVERLAAGQPAPGGALELRIAPRPPVAAPAAPATAATPTPARPTATRTASAAPARAPAAGNGPALPWSYDGSTGPSSWGALRPEYALCAQGQRQSPIDLQGGLPVDLEPVRFDYRASRFGVVDTGRTLQVNVAAGNSIELGGRKFELKRVQFHHPAEHRIDGRRFAMSAHLVHEDAEGRQAIVAVLLDPGPAQPVLQTVWSHIPLEKHQEQAARVGVDFGALLPPDGRYYTYMGSTTTPPCREGVQWVVMRTPMTLAPEQLELFARIYPMNARPVQAAAGRRILQSN